MKLLKEYFSLQKEIYKYFGYVENWKLIPIVDDTDVYWYLGEDVIFFDYNKFDPKKVYDDDFNGYSNVIYTQRHLDQYVYARKEYTMICADTRTDGNKIC